MDFSTLLIFALLAFAAFCVWSIATGPSMSDEDLATYKFGPVNEALICPHCQQRGQIRTKAVKRKKGVSGAKATGAILTGGVSMLATGLSRKEGLTAARCGHCSSGWDF